MFASRLKKFSELCVLRCVKCESFNHRPRSFVIEQVISDHPALAVLDQSQLVAEFVKESGGVVHYSDSVGGSFIT